MKNFILLLTLLLTFNFSYSQESFKAGLELDVLPYATGGYFGAAWVGKGHIRARVLYTKVNIPEFVIKDGFTNNTIRSYAVLGDYFLKEEFTGWWVGGGIVLWKGKIQTDQKLETASYNSFLLNGSLGYVFDLSPKFYLSPWTGLSLRTGGDSDIAVDGETYDPPLFNPEISLKLGYRF